MLWRNRMRMRMDGGNCDTEQWILKGYQRGRMPCWSSSTKCSLSYGKHTHAHINAKPTNETRQSSRIRCCSLRSIIVLPCDLNTYISHIYSHNFISERLGRMGRCLHVHYRIVCCEWLSVLLLAHTQWSVLLVARPQCWAMTRCECEVKAHDRTTRTVWKYCFAHGYDMNKWMANKDEWNRERYTDEDNNFVYFIWFHKFNNKYMQ